jgi:hypothetical protein
MAKYGIPVPFFADNFKITAITTAEGAGKQKNNLIGMHKNLLSIGN